MAYNSNKGTQNFGDIHYDGDPADTQIDFEDDLIALKTNNIQRLIVSASAITSSVIFSASSGIYAGTFHGDGAAITGIPASSVAAAGSTTQVQYNNGGALAGSSNLIFDGTSLTVGGLSNAGNTTLGDASGDSVTINAATVDIPNVAAGTDNTVVVYNGSTLLTDEIDSRVWGSTLVDATGTPVANQVAVWSDSNTAQGLTTMTYDGQVLSVTGSISGSGNISGSAFYGNGANLTGVGTMSSFTLAGDGGSSQTIADGNTLTVAGGTGLTTAAAATDTVSIALDNTAVSAGSYTFSAITVDAQGRLTSAASGTPSFTLAADAGSSQTIDNGNTLTIAGGTGLTSTAAATDTVTLALDNTAVSAGSYTKADITVDAQGRLTSAANGAAEVVTTYTNATDNYVLTSAGAGSINGEASLTFDGSTLTITGDAGIDTNYTGTGDATLAGIDIDLDKVGATTSDNTMYGVKVDMDNTSATDGANTMYGLHVTPTLTHAANAGTPSVYGALINAQGSTNGPGIVQGARIEAGGGAVNYGLLLDVEDGGVDLRIESSADSGDYFQIQTTTHGATTIKTQDDDATAAHLTFNVDGDITLDPAGGDVIIDGTVSVATNSHITGTLKVGTGIDTATSTKMMVSGSGNSVLAQFMSDVSPNILAMTGSGKVLIGGQPSLGPAGLHLDAKLNVSGSTTDKLISLKSDTGTAFYVEGGGDTFVSGNLRMHTAFPMIEFTSSHAAASNAQIGINNAGNILLQNNTQNQHIVLKTNDQGSIKEGFRLDGAVPEVVVNQTSDSLVDFRVESDNNTHMLYVDGSADKIGIDTNTPLVKLDINDNTIRVRTAGTPSSASDFGAQGEIRWDADYIYVCVATDTWKRVAISTW